MVFPLYSAMNWNNISIYDSLTGKKILFSTLLKDVNNDFSVVFVGEFHDDRITHQLEFELLNGLYFFNHSWNISMEMFERDVQKTLDEYLENKICETSFLKESRPWGNYKTDYRPLIEFAKEKGLDVVAANIPRKYAAMLVRESWEKLNSFPKPERNFIANKLVVINDKYRINFINTMIQNMGKFDKSSLPMIDKIYAAQCIKDDTMAESISSYLKKNPDKKLIHFNGRFHSDEHLGTAQKLSLLNPKLKICVISIIPCINKIPKKLNRDDKMIGDYIIYCLRNSEYKNTNKNAMFKHF